ncbi:MAG: nitric oxide synthase oxygenase [Kurthia sp.]|nr:nitric oxide synthase oxygenase [Candidatus Kurthia equi]
MLEKATDFIMQFYKENKQEENKLQERLSQIAHEIELTGSYKHTTEELHFGAKVAWRNSNKCIGRLFWNSLTVFDQRNLFREEDIFQALLQHIRFATNEGKIRPTISIFEHNRVRIWNDQLIRYAGYEVNGQIIGDPASIEVTKQCEKLGFIGEKTRFDLLPLIIQVDGQMPKLFELPKEDILEIPLTHSAYKWFEKLDLKWYAVPIISSMGFEIGGITYEAAPFNGWYMETEIGARNLADVERYNMLPEIAEGMGLSTKKVSNLWQDRALIELNHAVLESFKNQGVNIVDHHTAAQQFKLFEEQEAKNNREVTGNWAWLVPPLAGATTHIFHKPYDNTKKTPNYVYQKCPFH